MTEEDTALLGLVAALGDLERRESVCRELSARLGARELYVFVADHELDGQLVPAMGFAAVVPGGPEWRALLEQVRTPGPHRARVRTREGDEDDAVAYGYDGWAIVAVGLDALPELISKMAPMMKAMVQAEHRVRIAGAEVDLAQQNARRFTALARALEATRADLEQTLRAHERQAQQLDLARVEAEEATRVKDDFLAMLGHELRNPLAPIVTALELLDVEGAESRELKVIDRQVRHLQRLVDDLLDVARIARGAISIATERVELREVAVHAVDMASPLLEEKRQTLVMRMPEHGLPLDADPARFAQVIANLLINAARYSPEGAQVTLRADREDDRVHLRVEDEGVGLEPDTLERIFDRFRQENIAFDRSHGGLGLGLAIARSLVELHRGRIWAESDGLQRGAVFHVEVPALEVSEAEMTPRPADAPSDAPPNVRVLVVDDNEDAATMLTVLLQKRGYETCTAFDGPGALGAVRAFEPDVAILDIGLPVMDGYELAEHLRERLASRPPRFIALTGYGQASDRRRTAEAGFEAHLVKPVDMRALEALLAGRHGASDASAPSDEAR